MHMSTVPLSRQSARDRRAYYAERRGSWYGVNPVTKVIKNKKVYDRKRKERFSPDDGSAFFIP